MVDDKLEFDAEICVYFIVLLLPTVVWYITLYFNRVGLNKQVVHLEPNASVALKWIFLGSNHSAIIGRITKVIWGDHHRNIDHNYSKTIRIDCGLFSKSLP